MSEVLLHFAGRRADADSNSADSWAKPSRPLSANLATAPRTSADGDASRDSESVHDAVGPSATAAAQNGDYGPGSWLRPSPPVSVAGPATGDRDKFAALQQYIDELTQEKYELLRGMSSQRKVAETLEAQNQAIAEDFNRQAAQMGALREELAQLHAEVNAQRMALAAIAAERDAARSSAADSAERLKRLAAEVVDLEERVLRARSNELRAEKEAAAAAATARRAQSAAQSALLERGNLQSIVDTLQVLSLGTTDVALVFCTYVSPVGSKPSTPGSCMSLPCPRLLLLVHICHCFVIREPLLYFPGLAQGCMGT